ncbi:MAG: hypothetical protein AB8G11_08955 [Saprospiraceae bacterium]
MKTTLQLLTSLWLLSFSINTNAQTWNWANSLESVTGSDEARDIAADNQGNTYVTGFFIGTIETVVDTIVSFGSNDSFVAKYDSTGTLLWLRSGGGISNFDQGEAIAVDNNGNVFVTGYFRNSATFDNITVSSGAGQNAIFTAKYNSNGVIQWIKTGTNSNNNPSFVGDLAHDITIDNSGNVYIIGQKSGVTTFGSITVTNPNIFSIGSFFVKYDTNGNEIFGIPINPANISYQPARIQIVNNEVYILYLDYSNGYSLNVRKYNLSGTFISSFPAFTSGGIFQVSDEVDLAVDNNGNVTVYAEFQASVNVGGILLQSGAGFSNKDMFLAQQNAAGTIQWVKQIGGGGQDREGGIAIDTANNIYISGFFNNAISIDSTVLQATGQDIFVAKFNSSGNLQWARSAGSGNTTANSIFVNERGDAFVAGQFNGTAAFDNNIVSSSGSNDIFTAKLGCEPQKIESVLGDTLVCIGSSIYQAIANSAGNNFLWTISSGGTVTTNGNIATINWTTTGTHIITVSQVNECGAGESFIFNVTVKDVPTLPIINGDNTDCLGSSTYNVTNNSNSDAYNWSVSGGGNLFPLGNTAIVNWAVTGTHVLSVSASNLCGISPTGDLTINISEIPSQPSPIIGNSNVCQSTQNYTIPQVNSVNYIWSLSSGGTITASGNNATINWTTAGTHTLSVTPSNDCGVGSSRSILITVTETPSQPSTVVGNLTVCQGLQSYSVVGNSSLSYNWTISGGGNISSNNNNATVNWQTSGTYTMTIIPSNVCGVGTPRTVTVTVLDVPNQPSDILGIDTVCIGSQNYSVPPQAGVNFNWQLSGGGTVLPNNNLATINWTTPGTYTITVTPSNSCGTGQAKSRLIFVKNTNAQITSITGEDEPCLNIENYSVPSIAGLSYSWNVTGGGTITDFGNAAFVDWNNTGIYTLSVSTSDGCTNSLTVSVDDVPTQPSQIFGDTTVCLSFYNYSVLNAPDVNYTWTLSGGGILTQSGNAANVNWTQTGTFQLTATPSNDCGLGTTRTQNITVLDVPNTPLTITTTATNDTLACLSTETYSINSQSNVTYNFSLSGNGLLVQNQNSVDITWQTASIDNELIVTTSNICGTSGQQNLNIDVLDAPQVAPIQGDNDVCLNSTQTYIVPLVTENTYNWSLSSGGILTVVNDSAFVNWQTVGTHTLTVSPSNICGSGQIQTLQITVKDVPNQPTGFTGNTNACQTLEGYNITAETGVTYNWNLSSGGSLVALSNAANVNWTIPGTHTLTVSPSNECGTGTALNTTVSVQNVPTSPSAITGLDSACVNVATLSNYSTTTQSGLTYNWALSGGGTLTQNSNNATVNWNNTGNYILSVASTNTCGSSIPTTKVITVSDIPTQVTFSGATDVCIGDTETYIATGDATNYIWQSTGGTVNGNQITWTTTGTQAANLVATNACGSALTPLFQVVNVSDIPNIIQNIVGDSVVCSGISSYSLPTISGINYTWSISGGGTIQQINSSVNINWITPGTYTITAVPSNDCGNGNTITKQITVRDIPTITGTIQGLDTICTVQGLYTIALQTDVTYNWNLGSGGIVSPIGNNSVTILWTDEGTHTITVTPINICGTQGVPVTKTVTVLIPPQLAGDIFGESQVCNGETDSYLLVSGPTNWTFNWTIDNGNTVIGNANQATVDFNTIGTTTLSLAVGNQCGIAPTKTIEILVEDNAPTLTSDISGDTLVCRNSDVVYAVEGNPNFDYNWVLNDGGSLSTLDNSSIVSWQNEGTYNLGVFASNFCGTGDTLFKTVTVENPLFTPQITFINDTLFSNNNTLSQWFLNSEPIENTTEPFFRPIENGIYNVQSENVCGVTNTSNDFAFGLESGLFLYPNPGRYFMTLRIPEYMTWYSIDAIDQLGRRVLEPIEYNGSNEVLIDVRSLEAGLYWFRIDTEIILLYRKVVILD